MAKDFYHTHVREALIKDGWVITDDPYLISLDGVDYKIDLGAETLLAAEMGGRKIAVEIKSFMGPSHINELHRAIGQFVDYSVALELYEPNRQLFLALPLKIWKTLFQKFAIQKVLERTKANVIIYDPENIKIVEWKSL